MKKILITTFGTWGDIQPYIALGKGLKAAEYAVTICASEGFSSAIREFRGNIVYKQGVGPKPIPERHLNADRLAEAIIITRQDEPLKQRAAMMGAKIRAENGVACAVEIIDALINETVGTP